MLTLDQIRTALGDRNLSEVSRKTGIHYNVVYRAATDKTQNPAYETVKALSDYLEGE